MKNVGLTLGMMMMFCIKGSPYTLIVPDQVVNIQTAIDFCVNGDTILVKPGIYTENINFNGKNIVIGSLFLTTGDTSYITSTVIDANNQGSAVTFRNNENIEAKLIGFTVRNGTGTLVDGINYGGGVFCANAHPSLEYLRVMNNSAIGMGSGCGGGIYFKNSEAHLTHSSVDSNTAYYGGGIRCDSSWVNIETTTVRNNFAVGSGGGMMLFRCHNQFTSQCVFTGNRAIYGGAIALATSNPVLDRLTSYKNYGLYGGSLNIGYDSYPILVNSIFWDNAMHSFLQNEIYMDLYHNNLASAYNDIRYGLDSIINEGSGTIDWVDGNFSAYPEFADTVLMNLRLKGVSPCIDAGIAHFDYNMVNIINITVYNGNAPEMGAYEYGIPSSNDDLPSRGETYLQVVPDDNNSQTIRFYTSESGPVLLAVYDIQGEKMTTLMNGSLPSGKHTIEWNSQNVSPGIYLVQLSTGRTKLSKKCIVL